MRVTLSNLAWWEPGVTERVRNVKPGGVHGGKADEFWDRHVADDLTFLKDALA